MASHNRLVLKRGIFFWLTISNFLYIIVLLILAGISIAMLTEKNGLLTKSREAEIKTNHASVYEAMKIEAQSYYLEKRAENLQDDMITYFIKAKIIEENTNIINVEKLLGHILSTGNGTKETGDVYVLEDSSISTAKLAATTEVKVAETEEVTKTYIVKYYGKNNEEKLTLGNLNDKMEMEVDYSYLFKNKDGTLGLAGNEFAWYADSCSFLKKRDGSDVTDLTIPQQINGTVVTTIPSEVFSGSRTLVNVTLQEGLRIIEACAFERCTSLKQLNIPTSVGVIQWEACGGCGVLDSVTISVPATSLDIRARAFDRCTSLKSINFRGTKEQWNEKVTADGAFPNGIIIECTDGTIQL